MSEEIWKDIPGYEGVYQASTLGRIRSLDRTIIRSASKRRGPHEAKLKGQVIKPVLRKDGYAVVPLGKKSPCTRVHQIVAKTFIPNPENKPEVNHIDGKKSNNAVTNLEWCTTSENQLHSCRVLGHKPQNMKPVRCVETGEIFESAQAAAKGNRSMGTRINMVCNHYYGRKTCNGLHWEYL